MKHIGKRAMTGAERFRRWYWSDAQRLAEIEAQVRTRDAAAAAIGNAVVRDDMRYLLDRVRALEQERDRLRALLRRGRFYSDGHSNQADGCQRCALARDVDAALREETP